MISRWLAFLRGLWLFFKVAVNPSDTRAATDGTVCVNVPVLGRIRRRFERDEAGRRLLESRPRLDGRGVDFAALERLPEGTLGRAFAEFYRSQGLDPNDLQEMPPVVSGDEAYVAMRLRQSHDLWHLVTGIGTDLSGEIELQVFTFGQLHTPSSFLLGVLGTLQRSPTHRGLMARALQAYRRGRKARYLATVEWEKLFDQPLSEVRARLGTAE